MQRCLKIKRSKKRSLFPSQKEILILGLMMFGGGVSLIPAFFPGLVWSVPFAEVREGNIEKGRYLAAAAGCETCHTSPGKTPFSGGYRIKIPYGDILASNITPDQEYGIGKWSFEDFKNAMQLGLSPDGRHYFAAFPYPSYKDMTNKDLSDLYSYLMSLEPSPNQVMENQLKAPFSLRASVAFWKLMYLQKPKKIADRGEYLTLTLGHCTLCHSRKNFLGGPVKGAHLSGTSPTDSMNPNVPNITPHISGIGDWTKAELVNYLSTGRRPDGSYSGGKMAVIINQVTSKLNEQDRHEMAQYLMQIKPLKTPVQ